MDDGRPALQGMDGFPAPPREAPLPPQYAPPREKKPSPSIPGPGWPFSQGVQCDQDLDRVFSDPVYKNILMRSQKHEVEIRCLAQISPLPLVTS